MAANGNTGSPKPSGNSEGIPETLLPSNRLWVHRCVVTMDLASGKVERIIFREIFHEAIGCAQILAKHYDKDAAGRIARAFLEIAISRPPTDTQSLVDACFERLPAVEGAAEITDRSHRHVETVVTKILLALDSR